MIEMLFAMLVFTIISTAVAYGLQSASNSTRQDRNRIQAAHLAARELEIVREEFSDKDVDGPSLIGDAGQVVNPHPLSGQTAGAPITIDGLPFTLTRTATWLPAGAGASACDGGNTVTYPVLAVSVKVSWSRMGSTKPVESNTLLTPRKDQVLGTNAYAAVKVVGADGAGVPNLPVTVSNGSVSGAGTTADDGCAVVQLPATSVAQTFTATVAVTGYVSNTYTSSASGTLSIKAGTLARTTLSYDAAATLTIKQQTAGGFALPTQALPVTIYSSDIVGGTKSFVGTGASTTVTGLWPSTTGYISWPGACQQSDPAKAGGARQPAVVVPAGDTGQATHVLTALTVTVTNSASKRVAGAVVRAVAVSNTYCTTDATIVLGTTNAAGTLLTSLPAGSWTIQASGLVSSGAWPVRSVNPASTAQIAPILVTP